MNGRKYSEIKNELRKVPAGKMSLLMNFLRWLNYSDDVLSKEEMSGLKKAKKEKGGTLWKSLRQNA